MPWFDSMLLSSGAPKVYTTWNPSDKDSGCTLSNGNLTASQAASNPGGVRSIAGKTTGKWYWEVTWDNASTGTTMRVGIASDTHTIGTPPGATAGSYIVAADGSLIQGNTVSGNIGAITKGSIIQVGFDADGKTVTFAVNGGTQTTKAFGGGGWTGTILSALVGDPNTTGTKQDTANFGATAFTYTPFSGYNPGLYI
jgi:hypothetical protein